MNQIHKAARVLVARGLTNTQVFSALQEQFGQAVSTNLLAKFRRELRLKPPKEAPADPNRDLYAALAGMISVMEKIGITDLRLERYVSENDSTHSVEAEVQGDGGVTVTSRVSFAP